LWAGYMAATRCKTLYRWLHGGYMKPKNNKAPALTEAKLLISLVPEKGIEPSTFSLRMSCSTD
jgi:hypothetical protein